MPSASIGAGVSTRTLSSTRAERTGTSHLTTCSRPPPMAPGESWASVGRLAPPVEWRCSPTAAMAYPSQTDWGDASTVARLSWCRRSQCPPPPTHWMATPSFPATRRCPCRCFPVCCPAAAATATEAATPSSCRKRHTALASQERMGACCRLVTYEGNTGGRETRQTREPRWLGKRW